MTSKYKIDAAKKDAWFMYKSQFYNPQFYPWGFNVGYVPFKADEGGFYKIWVLDSKLISAIWGVV